MWDGVASSFQLSHSVYLRRCRTDRVGSLFNRSISKYVHNLVKTSTYTYVNHTLPNKLNVLTILSNQDFDDVMLSLLNRAKYTEE